MRVPVRAGWTHVARKSVVEVALSNNHVASRRYLVAQVECLAYVKRKGGRKVIELPFLSYLYSCAFLAASCLPSPCTLHEPSTSQPDRGKTACRIRDRIAELKSIASHFLVCQLVLSSINIK